MLYLFDVDGVLVHSRAYHLGLQHTIRRLSTQLGLGDHTLTQADIDEFEAATVTVEWESSAIAVARLVLDRLREQPVGGRGAWPALAATLAQSPWPVARPDFTALARAVGVATLPGQRPSLAALEMLRLEAGPDHGWLDDLLGHCYDIDRSPTMRVVQTFALGSEAYRRSYGHEAEFAAHSLLQIEDRPLLSPAWAARLLADRAAGRIGLTLYTARPSLPPREVRGAILGYTPEAEAALEQVGLAGIPILAVGRLQWVARSHGLTAEDLIKPSIVHPLAAMAAAKTGQEAASVEAALAVARGGPVSGPLTAVAGEHVHVFEDSASSLRAATRAVEQLNAHGLAVRLTRHGIAAANSPKYAALAAIADHVWPTVNDALYSTADKAC
jgi:hypothetical protein